MAHFYSDPARENEATALPDAEVFYVSTNYDHPQYDWATGDGEPLEPGWYYWYCFPGCLPDSDPIGPFATENEAIDDARDNE